MPERSLKKREPLGRDARLTARTVPQNQRREQLSSMAHADALRALELLSFSLQRGGEHNLGLLELFERLVATRGHGST